jgi:hypothetical protein
VAKSKYLEMTLKEKHRLNEVLRRIFRPKREKRRKEKIMQRGTS